MTENGSTTVMPVAPMGYGNGGFGGFGGDGSWLIVLFLFAMMGGWGNGGFGGGGSVFPWAYSNNTDNLVTSGFNQAATSGALSGIQSSITSGFGAQEIASCQRAMDAMQTSYNNQIASMNQSFANAQALDSRLDGLSAGLQQCCCENRASIADLKYTVASEACADRAAISSALRDVIEANTATTQRILDAFAAQNIAAKQDKIADLERQLMMANLSASQTAQTSQLVADNARQTAILEQLIAPAAV